MSILSYVDHDRKLALKDAIERKEELITQKYGYCDQRLANIRYELKYDVSFALLIDKREGYKIDNLRSLMYHPVTTEQDRDNIITYLYNLFSKRYNDQTITDYSIFPEIIGISRAFDRCVNVGLRRTAELITGRSNSYFTHFGWGEGTLRVLPKDTKLQIQVARSDMRQHGFAEPRGSEIAFFIRFLENLPTANVTEGAVFDSLADNATMLFRVLYTGSVLQHVANQDQVILMSLIYQLSV